MNKEEMLNYLKPIWDAANWNFNALKEKPEYQIRGIYTTYINRPNKVNKILNKNTKQMSLFSSDIK